MIHIQLRLKYHQNQVKPTAATRERRTANDSVGKALASLKEEPAMMRPQCRTRGRPSCLNTLDKENDLGKKSQDSSVEISGSFLESTSSPSRSAEYLARRSRYRASSSSALCCCGSLTCLREDELIFCKINSSCQLGSGICCIYFVEFLFWRESVSKVTARVFVDTHPPRSFLHQKWTNRY